MRAFAIGVSRSKNNTANSRNSNQENDSPNAHNPSQRRLSTSIRPALQALSIDHNVMMRQNTPLTSKSGNANMPSTYDKHNAVRPLMPTLSASAKGSNRTPLTPRVAGSTPSNAATPLARRSARPENATTPVTSSREDLNTPVSTFLNHNITPRSGSRKSRVDSTNTTPSGTPTSTPAPPFTNELFRSGQDTPSYGSALGGSDRETTKRSTVSFGPTPTNTGYARSPEDSNSAGSKFFFASDAKTVQTSRSQLQSKSPASFVYANGETIQPRPQSSSASAVGSAVGSTVGEERAQPKFFHANGVPNLQASPALVPSTRASSTVSTSTRMTSPVLAQSRTLSPPQRPPSPSKLNQQATLPALGHAPSLPSPPFLPRPQHGGRGQSANSVVSTRRASIEASKKRHSHSRSASSGSDVNTKQQRRVSSGSSFEPPLSAVSLNLITNTLPVSTPEEVQTEADTGSDSLSEIHSPTKTGQSLEQLNELAANARRERKVLDLEITNSSLAAINRTLEREMRKVNAELRRYRRLSRSGRLSIATSASRNTSAGSMSMADGEGGTMLSDMSEGEEDLEEESEYESESEDDPDGTLSPGAIAESDLRHRKRDERRLQLDLTKHQQLLTDSQKMNQSLKRCLGWTEELIVEGKKALAYNVKVSDVQLGGRVLLPEELEGEDNEGMSEVGYSLLKQARLAAATAAWGGEGRDDRDSGIELDGSQRSPIVFDPLPS
ncbi:hypothetical protein B0O99DRAFT_687368 [Bisporella sp. PMI_857]|nr:hypothetical protein B0O99DRAFT_687368 [Bisporella sp. PMI_857]